MTRFAGGVERSGPLHSGIAQLEWLSYQSGGSGDLENIGWTVPVPTGTPRSRVEQAVDGLLRRHEALRSTYDSDAAHRPQQSVHRKVLVDLGLIETAETRSFIDRPFDVRTEPPIRFALTDDGDLVFAVAHIAADGIAGWLLYQELVAAIAAPGGESGDRTDTRAAGQPLDHALDEAGVDRVRAVAALRHWESILSEHPPTLLPVTTGRRGAEIVGGRLDSLAALHALAVLRHRLRSSPSSIFTAAACLALAVQFARRRFGLSLTWAYRELPATRNLVAAVFRDMPLLIDLDGEPSFDEVVARVQRGVLRNGRRMGFDVLEFCEMVGRVAAERGQHLPGPEVVSCTFDGIDWEAVRLDGDLDALAQLSDLTPIRTNLPQDVCNVYVRSQVAGDRITIQSRIDSATGATAEPGDLVLLIEAILVRAATEEGLSFSAVERLARTPWAPGEGWVRIGDLWVDTEAMATRLAGHPEVTSARVAAVHGRVVARVRTELHPWELRDFMLGADNGRSASLSADRFVVEHADGTTVAGSGRTRPALAPVTAAERALSAALERTQNLGGATLADTYLTAGGRLFLAPRVIRILREDGYSGLVVGDFRRPISLRALAGRLRWSAHA